MAVIWPDMLPAVTLFMAMGTQWDMIVSPSAVIRTGLKYGSLAHVAASLKIDAGPGVFNDIRVMESAAIEVWSRQR